MLRIAICDDMPEELVQISQHIYRYINDHGLAAKVTEFSHPDTLLLASEKTPFDLYLLDIVMPMINGIDVGRELRKRQHTAQIVFLTSSDEFAVDAFSLRAAHYLIKPFTQMQFDEAMDRTVESFINDSPKCIPIRACSGELYSLDISDIFYIESQGHSITVYAVNRTLTESRRSIMRLQEELEALSPGQFISPYKGYVVNLKAVTGIRRDCMILRNGARIPIPKRDYRAIQNNYMDFLFAQNGSAGEVSL